MNGSFGLMEYFNEIPEPYNGYLIPVTKEEPVAACSTLKKSRDEDILFMMLVFLLLN